MSTYRIIRDTYGHYYPQKRVLGIFWQGLGLCGWLGGVDTKEYALKMIEDDKEACAPKPRFTREVVHEE